MATPACPFPIEAQLNSGLDAIQGADPSAALPDDVDLPGWPDLRIGNKAGLLQHLENELCSKDLDELAPRLWMLSTQRSSNVTPLHRQVLKNRIITIMEDPKLHLVWTADRIFLKPLPSYLMSAAFWTTVVPPSSSTTTTSSTPTAAADAATARRQARIRASALGLLRTYAHLIKHASDFRIAREQHLLPGDDDENENDIDDDSDSDDGDHGKNEKDSITGQHHHHRIKLTWPRFRRFMRDMLQVEDDAVSPRYAYGELRLSRLNFYSQAFLGRRSFPRRHRQYGSYFAQFYGPLLFVFAVFSLALNSMQVELGAAQVLGGDYTDQLGPGFWLLSRWFSLVTLCVVALIGLGLVTAFLHKFVKEWSYALSDRRRLEKIRRKKEALKAKSVV